MGPDKQFHEDNVTLLYKTHGVQSPPVGELSKKYHLYELEGSGIENMSESSTGKCVQ